MRGWALACMMLFTACSSEPKVEKAERAAGRAAEALANKDFEGAHRLFSVAQAELAKPFTDCEDALRAENLAIASRGLPEAIYSSGSPAAIQKAAAILNAMDAAWNDRFGWFDVDNAGRTHP